MTVNDIKSVNWQLSATQPGGVVEGVDDINQCIHIIVTTVPGSDPFRPDFGCGLSAMLDQPVQAAAPLMATRIKDAVTLWEPRVDVRKVAYTIEVEVVRFKLEWKLKKGFVFGDAEVLLGLFDGIIKSALYVEPGAYYGPVFATEDGISLLAPE